MKSKWTWMVLVLFSVALLGQLGLAAEEVKDVVCGMKGSAADFKYKSEYKEKTYHFCSAGCKEKFDKEPAKYANKEKQTATVKKASFQTSEKGKGASCDPANCQGHSEGKNCAMKDQEEMKNCPMARAKKIVE